MHIYTHNVYKYVYVYKQHRETKERFEAVFEFLNIQRGCLLIFLLLLNHSYEKQFLKEKSYWILYGSNATPTPAFLIYVISLVDICHLSITKILKLYFLLQMFISLPIIHTKLILSNKHFLEVGYLPAINRYTVSIRHQHQHWQRGNNLF